jgi:RHH-type transcriptional regulator, rel operon repressor / antitoxin RelB
MCNTKISKNRGGPKMLAVKVPEEIENRLNVLAKATGRTKSYYVREMIEKHLGEMEDIYLAETRLEGVRMGRSRTSTLDEVEDRLGLADKV